MELKIYTLVGLKLFLKKIKFKVLHYTQHDFICQHPGLAKDQTSLLLTISPSNIVTHCNTYIKRDKYLFFYKSMWDECSPEIKLLINRVET